MSYVKEINGKRRANALPLCVFWTLISLNFHACGPSSPASFPYSQICTEKPFIGRKPSLLQEEQTAALGPDLHPHFYKCISIGTEPFICVFCGYFHSTETELSCCYSDHRTTNLKYLLSVPLQRFVATWSKGLLLFGTSHFRSLWAEVLDRECYTAVGSSNLDMLLLIPQSLLGTHGVVHLSCRTTWPIQSF